MAEHRYALGWLRIRGSEVAGASQFAPRWFQIVLGACFVLPGAGIIALSVYGIWDFDRTTPRAIGIVLISVGVLQLFLRAYFALDSDRRLWREECGIGPLARKKAGSFDDALGLQMVTWEIENSTFHAVVWRWKDPGRRAHALALVRDRETAHRKWIELARELRVPLLEMTDGALTPADVGLVAARRFFGATPGTPPHG